jgi:hypothetical protein
MLTACGRQDAANIGLVRIKIEFLASHDIRCLDLFVDFTRCIKLSASAIKTKAIDIHHVYSYVMVWFFLTSVTPRFVYALVFRRQTNGPVSIGIWSNLGSAALKKMIPSCLCLLLCSCDCRMHCRWSGWWKCCAWEMLAERIPNRVNRCL